MLNRNPAMEEFDLEGLEELVKAVTSGGISWDSLESDPRRYVPNYRRVCPKRPDWKYPFQVVPVHFAGPSNRMIGCPREAGMGECPLCNLGFGMIKQGMKDEGKEILPNTRVFMNVVRLNENGELAENKVFLLSMNQTSFFGSPTGESEDDEVLVALFREYGDLAHIEYGRNLEIRAKQVKRGRYEFNKLKYSVTDPVPFPGDDELLEQLYDLPTVVPFVEPQEMVNIFEGRSFGFSMLAPGQQPVAALPSGNGAAEPGVIQAPASKKGGFARRSEELEEEEQTGDGEPSDGESETPVETTESSRQAARSGTAPTPKTNASAAAARLQANMAKRNQGK